LLAKGRIAGIQFETLSTDGLYSRIGERAITAAARIRTALREKGYRLTIPSPTNQIFITLTNAEAEQLGKIVEMSFMEQIDADHAMMRICTSWATKDEDVEQLISCL
jgi:threonine aldolase